MGIVRPARGLPVGGLAYAGPGLYSIDTYGIVEFKVGGVGARNLASLRIDTAVGLPRLWCATPCSIARARRCPNAFVRARQVPALAPWLRVLTHDLTKH